MHNISKLILLSFIAISLTNCRNDDSGGTVKARPYAEVYPEDLLKIEDYLETHYVTVTRNANNDVIDVELGKIASGTPQTPIADDPLLTFKTVKLHDLEYKVYYLKLSEGLPIDNVNYNNGGKQPCGADNVITSYSGYLLDGTEFEFSATNETFNLLQVIKGWEYIFPEFRSGRSVIGSDGLLVSQDYGSGIMFLPSGLGYYSQPKLNIPAYSPLIFAFNLHGVVHTDLDGDMIESRFEYGFDADGKYIDTDGDKIPDFADKDDDNDTFPTKDEIMKPAPLQPNQGTSLYYPFNPIADDPSTPSVDESEPKGIPDASGDGTTTTRLRRHLDKNAKPPYITY